MDKEVEHDPQKYIDEWFNAAILMGKEFELPNISNDDTNFSIPKPSFQSCHHHPPTFPPTSSEIDDALCYSGFPFVPHPQQTLMQAYASRWNIPTPNHSLPWATKHTSTLQNFLRLQQQSEGPISFNGLGINFHIRNLHATHFGNSSLNQPFIYPNRPLHLQLGQNHYFSGNPGPQLCCSYYRNHNVVRNIGPSSVVDRLFNSGLITRNPQNAAGLITNGVIVNNQQNPISLITNGVTMCHQEIPNGLITHGVTMSNQQNPNGLITNGAMMSNQQNPNGRINNGAMMSNQRNSNVQLTNGLMMSNQQRPNGLVSNGVNQPLLIHGANMASRYQVPTAQLVEPKQEHEDLVTEANSSTMSNYVHGPNKKPRSILNDQSNQEDQSPVAKQNNANGTDESNDDEPEENGDDLYKCFVCDATFTNGNALGGHMSSHSKKRKAEALRNNPKIFEQTQKMSTMTSSDSSASIDETTEGNESSDECENPMPAKNDDDEEDESEATSSFKATK